MSGKGFHTIRFKSNRILTKSCDKVLHIQIELNTIEVRMSLGIFEAAFLHSFYSTFI